jgi:hypothetical protein
MSSTGSLYATELLQSLVVLAKEFPGNGTPLDLARKYQWLPASFFKETSKEEQGLIELLALSEFNRREKDRRDKEDKRRQDERDHPGMERYKDDSEFWAEVNKANQETSK